MQRHDMDQRVDQNGMDQNGKVQNGKVQNPCESTGPMRR